MPRARLLHLAGAAAAALATTLTATAGPSAAAAPTAGAVSVTVSGSSTSPTNAAAVFKWGSSAWEDEFRKRLSKRWRTSHKKLVRNQVGMLTLDATRKSGSVWATVPGHARRYGRWEARVRAEQNGAGGEPYRVLWELIPAGKYLCGSKNIDISRYHVGDERVWTKVRTPSGPSFRATKRRDLGDNVWHTYAVEITRQRISWFVDTKVIRTERRDKALTGTKYQMRFRLDAVKDERMNPTRMQMDWVRYYNLDRPNARSVKAPGLIYGFDDPSC